MIGKRQITAGPERTKGLIRSLNRIGVRDDKSPQVVRKTLAPHEPTICVRCGAVFIRRTWRHDHALTDEQLERGEWGFCPACVQVAREEAQGRFIIRGAEGRRNEDMIRRRIRNVAARASKTQPERRIVSIDTTGAGLEVLTTSQKLAHRLAHELKKAFGGRVAYNWSDDGTLFAIWDYIDKEKNGKSN
jgi:NMD protein affecting ribosome stability and mRNA decay